MIVIVPVRSNAQTAPQVGLSLNEAVDRILVASPQVRQTKEELQAQVEKTRGSWTDLGPRVSLEYNQVHFEDEQTVQLGPDPIKLRDDIVRNGSVTVAQPIAGLLGLTEKARFESLNYDLKEAAHKLNEGSVAFQAAQTFLQAVQSERLLEIAAESVAAAEGQLRDGRALEKVGRVGRADALRLELALSDAQAKAAQAKAARDVAFATLKIQMGLEISDVITLDRNLPDLRQVEVEETNVIATAVAQRLELKQAEYGVEAARFGRELAYIQFAPSVNLFAKMERNFGELTGFGAERDVKTYGLQAKWDIWNNGSSTFAVRESARQVAKAEAMGAAARDGLKIETYAAVTSFNAAKAVVNLAEVAVRQADESYRIDNARFNTGAVSTTNLIQAGLAKSGAQGNLVSARTNLVLAYFQVMRAQGALRPTFP